MSYAWKSAMMVQSKLFLARGASGLLRLTLSSAKWQNVILFVIFAPRTSRRCCCCCVEMQSITARWLVDVWKSLCLSPSFSLSMSLSLCVCVCVCVCVNHPDLAAGNSLHSLVRPHDNWGEKWFIGNTTTLQTMFRQFALLNLRNFWATVYKTVRSMLSDRCPVCPVCLSLCL